MTESVSESENPAIPSPDAEGALGRRTNQDWWPNQLDLRVLHQHSPLSNPMGDGLRLRGGVRGARPRGAEARPRRADDDVAGLVAGRLRPLRAALHPHDAGTPPAPTASPTAAAAAARARSASRRSTAGPTTRTSTRRAGCSGRSSRSTARRSRGPTCSSSPATSRWSRWGSRRSASASGAPDIWEPEEIFWGPEDTWLGDERYSGDRELAGPARRGADGPHLREPGGAERQPRPAGRRARHPRDVRAAWR